MGRKQTGAQRMLRWLMTAELSEARTALDLARVVVEAREGVGDRPKRKARIKVSVPPNEDEA